MKQDPQYKNFLLDGISSDVNCTMSDVDAAVRRTLGVRFRVSDLVCVRNNSNREEKRCEFT